MLASGGGWLASHPEKEQISRRYLKHRSSLFRQALARLVEQEEGDGAIGGTNPVNSNIDNIIAAYFVWSVTETVVTNARGTISHDVRPLGVKLDNIKIPQSIADKVQGFKIYYEERNHANR